MKFYLYISMILLLVCPITAFCIYNETTDNTKISITQLRAFWPNRIFKANLSPGQFQCCNYTNRDCSPQGVDNDIANFSFEYENTAAGKSGKHELSCTTGGGIAFYGKGKDVIAYCTKAKGATVKVY